MEQGAKLIVDTPFSGHIGNQKNLAKNAWTDSFQMKGLIGWHRMKENSEYIYLTCKLWISNDLGMNQAQVFLKFENFQVKGTKHRIKKRHLNMKNGVFFVFGKILNFPQKNEKNAILTSKGGSFKRHLNGKKHGIRWKDAGLTANFANRLNTFFPPKCVV